MITDSGNLKVVMILTIGFTLASIFSYFSQRLKLSPILGYLLAGYVIGPFSPGFVADLEITEQLAEVGVMLMMFGVGMHFKLRDLISVKNIAIPGAISQTLITAAVATFLIHALGGSVALGVLIGLAIGVASTVVLVRVLSDQNILHTFQGHVAVGWLIVEDILTVAVLILLPTIATVLKGGSLSIQEIIFSILLVVSKFSLFAFLMFTVGQKIVSYLFLKIARMRSPELFTLCVLALTFFIATGSALLFGTSIALGAFIAGMVIGQTDVKHQASASASPMKDAFVVIFFLTVGMLFNPHAIAQHFSLFISILGIILIIKPLAAFLLVLLMGYEASIALPISIALAQIGEFSFILAEEAEHYHLFSDEAFDCIVASALISISLNPLFFKLIDYFKPYLENRQNQKIEQKLVEYPSFTYTALVVGFNFLGRNVVETLKKFHFRPIIIDHNVDEVANLVKEGYEAIYSELPFSHMLEVSKIESVQFLVFTILDLTSTLHMLQYVKETYPGIKILACAKNLEEQNVLKQAGAHWVFNEEKQISERFNILLVEAIASL